MKTITTITQTILYIGVNVSMLVFVILLTQSIAGIMHNS